MTVKDLCKLIYELRPDVDITVAGDFGEGVNDRAWCYSTIYDSKPPNFENMVTKDKEVTAVEIARGPELNDESVTVCFDMSKKEEKMKSDDKKDNREPLKLLTQLSYIEGDEGDDVWLEIRLERRNEYDSKYVFVEGFAEALKDDPEMFYGYYVDRILYDEPDEGERHLLVQAVKEETINNG